MLQLIDPQPVGLPALVALMLGFTLMVLALLAARRRRGSGGNPGQRAARSWIGILVQGLAIAIVAFGPIRPTLPSGSPLAIGETVAVLVLMLFAVALFTAASRTMGRNWSVVAQTRADHQLVTTGPFAVVRHPIYVAMFALPLAFAIAYGHWHGLWIGVPLYWLGTWLRIVEEEKLLRAQFGAAYDDYARRVKRFIPGVL